jgi:hypothetical protein
VSHHAWFKDTSLTVRSRRRHVISERDAARFVWSCGGRQSLTLGDSQSRGTPSTFSKCHLRRELSWADRAGNGRSRCNRPTEPRLAHRVERWRSVDSSPTRVPGVALRASRPQFFACVGHCNMLSCKWVGARALKAANRKRRLGLARTKERKRHLGD